MKFDKLFFGILKHSQPDEMGYVNNDKALILMEKGYLEKSPKSEWIKSGHKTTKKGTELYNKWLKEIRDKHGHVWETNGDSRYSDKEDSDYNKKINSFAFSEGYHNGFKCKKCGFEFCMHCYHESEIEKCSQNSKGKTKMDNSKINRGMIL